MNPILERSVAIAKVAGGKAGRKAGSLGWGIPASKRQFRMQATNRQHTADFQRDAGRTDGTSARERASDRRIIGGNLRRKGSYSPLKKRLEDLAKARGLMPKGAKARTKLANTFLDRNDKLMAQGRAFQGQRYNVAASRLTGSRMPTSEITANAKHLRREAAEAGAAGAAHGYNSRRLDAAAGLLAVAQRRKDALRAAAARRKP